MNGRTPLYLSAALVVIFENRSGVDNQPEFGSAERLLIRAQVVAKTIRQRADRDSRIDRYCGGQWCILRTRTGRTLSTGSETGQRRDREC